MHSRHQRLDYLDLLRVIALGSVICFHYLFSGISKGNIKAIEFSSFAPIAQYGYLGVELFFMISGFVILYSTNRSAGEFVRKRFLRLYPMFWMAIILIYLVTLMPWWKYPAPPLSKALWNLTMIPTAFGQERLDAAHWFLVRELQFYVVIAFVLAVKKGKLLPKIFPVWAIVICIWNLLNLPDFNIWYFSGYLSLITGGAIIYSIRTWGWNPLRVIGLVSAYVGAVDTRISIIPVIDARRNAEHSAFVIAVVVTVIFLLMLTTLIPGIERLKIGWVGMAGAITYPLFLIHGRIGAMIIEHTANEGNKWFVYGLTLLGLICVAYGLLKLEKRVLKWRVFSRLAR